MNKKIVNGEELAGKKFEVLEDGTLRMIKSGKYIPKFDDAFYYSTLSGTVGSNRYRGYEDDEWLVKHNHVFRTEEECREYKHYLELLDRYTFEADWSDIDESKFYICYMHDRKCLNVYHVCNTQYADPYFESEEKAREFIDEAGEENIKRFMFDIWE